MTQAQVESSAEASKLRTQLSEMIALMREKDKRIARMEKECLALKERLKLSDKKTYGSKSQKSKEKDDGKDSNDDTPDRQRQKDAFGGIEESLGEVPNEAPASTQCVQTGERKNSLFFGSDRMARVSAAYHTVISTCRAQGISALEYLKRFFREIASGRRDYENLMPMTIGINVNNQ